MKDLAGGLKPLGGAVERLRDWRNSVSIGIYVSLAVVSKGQPTRSKKIVGRTSCGIVLGSHLLG